MAHNFTHIVSVSFEHDALTAPVNLSHTPEAASGIAAASYDEADGTFARLWPTSFALARFLCENPSLVAGKRIVELGSGSGAVGLVCAALGATSVTLTDLPDAMTLLATNLAQNPTLAPLVKIAPCAWGSDEHISSLLEDGPFDIVLCCEVVYQQSADILAALAQTQRRLAKPSGQVLLGYEFRSAMSEDIAYFDAATELFGESTSHSLEAASVAAAAYMGGHADDGGDDRWLYVYEVPAKPPAQSVVRLTSIAELSSHLRDGDLLLLDIDETLVSPEEDATEPWFNKLCAAMGSSTGRPMATVFSAGVEIWQALQSVCDVTTPEESTAASITAAAKLPGVECVGLTARGPEIHDETIEQLTRCGVYDGVFSTTLSYGVLAPVKAGEHAILAASKSLCTPLTHIGGIIYCSGSRKPQGLRAYEAAAKIAPTRRVVLLDDRESHCIAVCDDRKSRDQPFLGLHYAPAGSEGVTCELPRGWQLLAASMGSSAGRQRIRRMVDLLEDPDGADAGGPLTMPVRAAAFARSGLPQLVAGAAIGGAAMWAVLRK